MRILLAVLLFWPALLPAQERFAWIQTTEGPLLVRMDTQRTPNTVANFERYVDAGFYNRMLVHRVAANFVVQSGIFREDGIQPTPPFDAIGSERDRDGGNRAGTIGLALTGNNINSGQASFYFNLIDNTAALDSDFTAFGEVAFGVGTLERINALPTSGQTPLRPPLIEFAVMTDGFPVMPLHAGSWFDPLNPRRGFVLEITNDASSDEGPLANIYWYDYSNGQQLWATGLAAYEHGATSISIPLLVTEGGQFGAAFDPAQVVVDNEFGTLTIRFTSCTQGQFSYDTRLGSGSAPVTRLTIPPGSSCLRN